MKALSCPALIPHAMNHERTMLELLEQRRDRFLRDFMSESKYEIQARTPWVLT